nr:MAG TPA: hypothetical protein [Caudoviricetes sp.]
MISSGRRHCGGFRGAVFLCKVDSQGGGQGGTMIA